MIFAYDENKKRINALFADKSKEYICPTCGCKVIPRQGNHNIYHFAHPQGSNCDLWNYDMSEWHRAWQSQFPEDMQEVVLSNSYDKHRADVLLEDRKLVVEFQHSPLSDKEFRQRNDFYLSCGYDVVWLFDISDKRIEPTFTSHQYKWNWGSSTFCDFYPPKEKRVTVFFQFSDAPFDEDFDNGVIEKLSWIPEYTEKIKIFRTEDYLSITPFEFVDYLKTYSNIIEKKPTKPFNVSDLLLPQDSPYGVEFDLIIKRNTFKSFEDISNFVKYSINGEPNGRNIMYFIRCSNKVEITDTTVIDEYLIKYHIKTHMVNEIDKFVSECREDVVAALKRNSKTDISIENFSLFGRTIPQIMRTIKSKGAGVINLQTGKDFYVPNSEYFKKDNISFVKGRPKLSYGYKYSTQYQEVFRAFNPEWIVKFIYH